jgi:hypothetical protein
MNKKPVRGDRKALIEAEKLAIQSEPSIQSDSHDCVLIIDSDAGATNNPGAEEETGLFRPKLHWISK